ncbi:MAG: hypothetical protein ABMA25_07935 [Ilumatobacteraceae bacterium]
MSGDPHLSTAARAAAALVALVGVCAVAWNAAAGLRVADEYGRGPFVEQSRQSQQVTDCFTAVVVAAVPAGARLHLDIDDASFEQRLTEGPYPHAVVVPPDEPADYLVHVALGAVGKFLPCPGYTVTVTPLAGGG